MSIIEVTICADCHLAGVSKAQSRLRLTHREPINGQCIQVSGFIPPVDRKLSGMRTSIGTADPSWNVDYAGILKIVYTDNSSTFSCFPLSIYSDNPTPDTHSS